MKNVKKTYTDFHLKKTSVHLYPTEWVIRTMLGNYPKLKLDNTKYKSSRILDLGFGDGRNMSLLHNCGFEIHGVEISSETVETVGKQLQGLGINAELKVGSNSSIPYPNDYFDYILASASCYYIDEGDNFDVNLEEITRVLKTGGYFIANLPALVNDLEISQNFILKDITDIGDGHVIINNDPFGLRNGYCFKVFSNENEIRSVFGKKYTDISIGRCLDDFYGLQINAYLLVCRKM